MTPDPARHALRRRPLFMPYITVVVVGLVALGILGWLAWPQPPSTVIVVRHAEKLEGQDPSLSPAGVRRAEDLARMLAPVGISAIYATQTARALETATPLASRLSLPVETYRADDAAAFAAGLRRRPGEVILVVGHSNTVPDLVQRLGGRDVGTLDEGRYGDVFIVVRPRWGRATVMRIYQPALTVSNRT